MLKTRLSVMNELCLDAQLLESIRLREKKKQNKQQR